MIKKLVHKFEMPNTFCMLVIDDQFNKVSYQNCFRACIEAYCKKNHILDSVELLIDFANEVDVGFENWLKNSYDLVLIDYDFSKNEETPTEKTPDKFSISSIFPEKQGIELIRFIDQVRKGEEFGYKKEFQDIYLWTAHRLKKEKDKKEVGVSIDLKEHEIKYYLNKGFDQDGNLDPNCNEIIGKKILEKFEKNKDLSAENLKYFVLERIVSLEKNKKYSLDGYISIPKNPNDYPPYPPLKEGVPIYLFPNKPDSEKYYSKSIAEMAKLASTKLSLKELLKKLLNESEKKPAEINKIERCNRLYDKYIIDKKIINNIYKVKGKIKHIKKTKFAGIDFDSDIWLASTPLTMVTLLGEEEKIFEYLKSKLEEFFNAGIGAAVLKTTYFESEGIAWPTDHIQRFHRTRVFNPKKFQLWNTGKTALESFPPKMLNRFLKNISNENKLKDKIIVSLGIKTKVKKESKGKRNNIRKINEDWKKLFNNVFEGIEKKHFPLVEINVRHFLRPLLKAYLGGDEYLSIFPSSKIAHIAFKKMLKAFTAILSGIDKIAIGENKKIILKFPFRSDIILFLKEAQKIRNKNAKNNIETGIRGVTLINTAKSPYANGYSDIAGTDDEIKMPQMSGECLAWLRNFLLLKLKKTNLNLDISVSGGVAANDDDIDFLRNLIQIELVQSIQLGTVLLKDINNIEVKDTQSKLLKVSGETKLKPRFINLIRIHCKSCGKCYESYYCDAFLNRGDGKELPLIDVTACTGCGLCVQNCPTKSPKDALKLVPAEKHIVLCCPFSESRAYILRENEISFMFMEGENEDNSTDDTKLDYVELAKQEAKKRAENVIKKCIITIKKKGTKNGEINPLEHSIFLGVKTFIFGKKEKSDPFKKLNNIPSSEDEVIEILKNKIFKAITAYCIKNKKIVEGHCEAEFTIKENLNLNEYCKHGVNRAGGIDILGYGEFLFGDLKGREEDIMTFAGLPLKAIEDIKNLTKPDS